MKEEKNLLFSVYRDANVWPKAGVEDPALGQMSNFFGSALFAIGVHNVSKIAKFNLKLSLPPLCNASRVPVRH